MFVSAPLLGHVFPLLPLATALRDAGHDVLIASGGDVLGADVAGLPVRDIAQGVNLPAIALRLTLAHPLLSRHEFSGRGGTVVAGRLFGAVNAKLTDAAVALVGEWRPDLVVHEPLAAAGAVAAARHGVPAVLQENNLWDGPELVAATVGSMGRALARHGVAALPAPAAVISTAPPSLVGTRSGLPMRAVPASGAGELPDWLTRPADGPRIVVSHSTIAGPPVGNPMPPVVAAAGDVDAEVVLVRPSAALTRRALPPDVRTVGWVPLTRVLPHASAFVHHGGAGGVLGALTEGVPQLAVPGPGDRRFNAELVARRGAGLAVEPKAITAEVLMSLVRDAGLRAAAGEVRAEMAAMPEPAALVPELERLRG